MPTATRSRIPSFSLSLSTRSFGSTVHNAIRDGFAVRLDGGEPVDARRGVAAQRQCWVKFSWLREDGEEEGTVVWMRRV